jgi:hypothetical protein
MIPLNVGFDFQSEISALQRSDGICPPHGVAVCAIPRAGTVPDEYGGCQSSSGRAVRPSPGNHGEHGANETYQEEGYLHGAPSESGPESCDQEQETCGGEPSRDKLLFPRFHGITSSFLVGGV